MLMDVAMTRNTCLYTPNSCWLRRRTRINGRAKFRANAAVFATRYQMVLDESDSFGFASNFIRETSSQDTFLQRIASTSPVLAPPSTSVSLSRQPAPLFGHPPAPSTIGAPSRSVERGTTQLPGGYKPGVPPTMTFPDTLDPGKNLSSVAVPD